MAAIATCGRQRLSAKRRGPSTNGNISPELEALMSQVQVEQKTYQMPPKDGFTVALFITVADVQRSLRFYETVF
jgi:hypothetical protein